VDLNFVGCRLAREISQISDGTSIPKECSYAEEDDGDIAPIAKLFLLIRGERPCHKTCDDVLRSTFNVR
jgi:hypothetical protein